MDQIYTTDYCGLFLEISQKIKHFVIIGREPFVNKKEVVISTIQTFKNIRNMLLL